MACFGLFGARNGMAAVPRAPVLPGATPVGALSAQRRSSVSPVGTLSNSRGFPSDVRRRPRPGRHRASPAGIRCVHGRSGAETACRPPTKPPRRTNPQRPNCNTSGCSNSRKRRRSRPCFRPFVNCDGSHCVSWGLPVRRALRPFLPQGRELRPAQSHKARAFFVLAPFSSLGYRPGHARGQAQACRARRDRRKHRIRPLLQRQKARA